MMDTIKTDDTCTVTTVVFIDKSRAFAGAEQSLCVLTEHLKKSRFPAVIAADYPLPHHIVYKHFGAVVHYRTTEVKWWMGSERWQRPLRGTDAIKRMIFARRLRNMMTACDARILHVNLLSQNSRADLAAARRMGMRTVGHVRSLLSQRLLDKRCLELCDVVICISDYVAREVTGLTETSRIERIYCPVPAAKMVELEERNNAKYELGLSGDALVISSVAMLDPRKGHDVAILAFAKLSADFPNATLLIVGGTYSDSGNAERERLQKIARDAGIGTRVVFSGYVSEMRKVYAASDIVLALSKDGEAFGRVPAEAAAHGRVAIATAMGATPELIIDGVTGLLVPPNDPDAVVACCLRVFADGDMAGRIGTAGMEHVARNFHPDTIARQVEAVYESLLKPLSSTGQIEGGAAIRMKESMKSDNALTRATVVFMDKSRLLAGAERCLCVLTEHLDKTRFRTMIAADYPLPHHTAYQRSGVEVRYRTTGVKWWMGTDRWRHPPRGTDAIKRIIFARQLRNMMTACDARILHVNLLSQNSRADFAAARRMGMRTVGHVRSLLSQRLLDKRCLELCDVVICISDYVAREIIGLTEASQIVQIYDPVSLVKMVELEERNNAKDELGLNADAIVISSVAMLDPRKGHDVAILAFAKLLADFPNAMLLIVGGVYEVSGNTEWERLQKIAIDSGVGSRVVFSGYVSEMRKVYAASDIVLALSKDGEAFGLVPAEAAAHGRVAIATAMGATPELIIDGVTGFLVPPNDPDAVVACCRRVLTDSYLARRIGLEGMEHVARKFHPGTIARQIETVYDRLLQL